MGNESKQLTLKEGGKKNAVVLACFSTSRYEECKRGQMEKLGKTWEKGPNIKDRTHWWPRMPVDQFSKKKQKTDDDPSKINRAKKEKTNCERGIL